MNFTEDEFAHNTKYYIFHYIIYQHNALKSFICPENVAAVTWAQFCEDYVNRDNEETVMITLKSGISHP